MQEFIYPFKEVKFNNSTSIYLDSCFILSLMDCNDDRYYNCDKTASLLKKSNCKLFISDFVFSEVIYNLIFKMFVEDIQDYIKGSNELYNTTNNIKKIVNIIDADDIAILQGNNQTKIDKINYKRYFNNIYKHGDKKTLKYLFANANKMFETMQNFLNYEYLFDRDIETMLTSKYYMNRYLLLTTDSLHFSIATNNNMEYFLTLDKDFSSIQETKSKQKHNVKILKIN